ncbi:MAG: hypothetical protein ACI8WY_003947 [Planctomycetota bacterium]|jgi:hypothetical protein
MTRPARWSTGALLTSAMLGAAALSAPSAPSAASTGASTCEPARAIRGSERGPKSALTSDSFAEEAARFIESLGAFRRGEEEARAPLIASAALLRDAWGRPDPADVAAFYAGLTAEARQRGTAWEAELDALHARGGDLAAGDLAGLRALRHELREFHRLAQALEDVPVRAHALSLEARFSVRLLEQQSPEEAALDLEEAAASASEALRLFGLAGQVTPALEPRWILARCALLRSDLDAAEGHYAELAEAAEAVGRPAWRERGLLGLIGLARERGSLFEAEERLEDLASFRSPETCWSLAREVAAQMVLTDDGVAALDWLERYPPGELDGELAAVERGLDRAAGEWRQLVSAAELRSGQVLKARERMDRQGLNGQLMPFDESDGTSQLIRAAIYLGSNEPALALKLVRELRGLSTTAISHADRLSLEGRALLELGRSADAIAPLEEALNASRAKGAASTVTARMSIESGSRVGEWLGLSAVETLGRAYAESGSPLRAAALFEWVHATGLTRLECESRLLGLAAGSELGYLTWMVGADRTMAVYVRPDGLSVAFPIPLGRRALSRGIERLRDSVTTAGAKDQDPAWQELGAELFSVLFPEDLRIAIGERRDDGARLVLAPHGVLERLPFEALSPFKGGRPLGISTALSVVTTLRPADGLGPALDGRTARWMALGAPVTTRFDALPGAKQEIEQIGRLHPRWNGLTGHEMTRRALEEALTSRQPLHLATHVAQIEDGSGARSVAPFGFVVSDDQIITAREVRALGPRLPLAVLTACGSAEGTALDGLSVRGLAQMMLACGTRTAIVTLWPIQDEAARRASVRLHAALLGGADPAEGTRRAREFLWKLGAPPSEWAAYRTLE